MIEGGKAAGDQSSRRVPQRVRRGVYMFESPADAELSKSSNGAGAPAAVFGKTAFADFASAG